MKHADQPVRIAAVQAHRRLVENVKRLRQARPQRRRHVDPLRLAARKRSRRPVERQITQADLVEVLKPRGQYLQDAACYLPLGFAEPDSLEELEQQPHRQHAEFRDALARETHVQRLGLEPRPPALRAGRVGSITREHHAGLNFVLLRFEPIEKAAHAREFPNPLDQVHPLIRTEVLDRLEARDLVGRRSVAQEVVHPQVAGRVPGRNRSVLDAEFAVGDDLLQVELHDAAEPLAFGTRAERAIE